MNIAGMMAQAKKMQEQMEKKKKELEAKEFKIEKQGITVIMSGDKKIKSIDINEILVDPDDKEMLEDMIIIAVNEGIEMIEAESQQTQSSMMPGMPF